jgi:hypothetical protein
MIISSTQLLELSASLRLGDMIRKKLTCHQILFVVKSQSQLPTSVYGDIALRSLTKTINTDASRHSFSQLWPWSQLRWHM